MFEKLGRMVSKILLLYEISTPFRTSKKLHFKLELQFDISFYFGINKDKIIKLTERSTKEDTTCRLLQISVQ